MNSPLADRIRPRGLDDVVGQKHILGEGRLLRFAIESGRMNNMIFYGPSGTGKTTVANIIASTTNRNFYKLNAVSASVADVREVIKQGNAILYLDEIQNFNKKQQQALLEVIENGEVVLIASTTENPYFYVYNAILSRSTVFEFKPLLAEDIEGAVRRAARLIGEEIEAKVELDSDAMRHIAGMANGDVRRALNALEMAVYHSLPENGIITVTKDVAEQSSQKKALNYDKMGDNHYDLLSALQKSIRGSDPDAAIHYLARLVAAEDLPSICRRLLVMAAEDVGMAYPMAVVITKACVDSALQLGFPEARIPLAEAVVMLATAPKSNSAYLAIDAALADINKGKIGEVPRALQNKHYDGAGNLEKGQHYMYPHDYENAWVKQEYMPKELKGRIYYNPKDNKFEQNLKEYWSKIKT